MTGMIEKVARALCVADGYMPEECDVEVGHTPAPLWHDYINRARAAIEAMREPGSALMKAGATRSAMEGPPEFQKLNAAAVWQAMITAALSEGDG